MGKSRKIKIPRRRNTVNQVKQRKLVKANQELIKKLKEQST
jgi:hypothetical protein